MAKNVIGVGIIKKKLLGDFKIQNCVKDVQTSLILNLLKSSFFNEKKVNFYFHLNSFFRFILRVNYEV